MLDVIYYHYFLYYKRYTSVSDVHVKVSLVLSASESFLLTAITNMVASRFFCSYVELWINVSIFLAMGVFNSWYYLRGKGEEIIGNRPLLFNSKKFSIIFTLLFFILSFSWLFWGHIYTKYMVENCQGH